MKLFICEKPSLARKIVDVLKKDEFKYDKEKEAYYGKTCIVTSLFGHILELEDFTYYTGNEKWLLEDLPVLPQDYKYKVKKGLSKKTNILKKLIKDKSVSVIYHTGDADREGEILVREILNYAGYKGNVLRVYPDNETSEGLKKAITNAKNDTYYDNLANSGFLRMYADYDFGLNLTRFVTLTQGQLYHIGRVSGCLLKEIREREIEIEKFVSQTFYYPLSKEDNIELKSKNKFETQNECQELVNIYNNGIAFVADISEKKVIAKKPLLFSQNTLQSYMSKTHNMKPAQTLKISQSLYEKNLLSYPRTNTEYLTKAEVGDIQKLISDFGRTDIKCEGTEIVFNDKKTEEMSHSALKPLKDISKVNLTGDEEKVYREIFTRFLCAFCSEDHEYIDKTMVVTVDGKDGKHKENFNVKGKQVLKQGFKKYLKEEQDVCLPPLKKGDMVNKKFEVTKAQTKPPKLHTVASLNDFMVNPMKIEIGESDDKYYKEMLAGVEIGTQATRAGIIDNLIKRKYITLKQKSYQTTTKGKELYELFKAYNIDVSKNKTSDLNKEMKLVEKGEKTLKDVLKLTEEEISNVINNYKGEIKKMERQVKETQIKCPVCGEIMNYVKGTSKLGNDYALYACSNRKCDFSVFEKVASKTLSENDVRKLIENGKIGPFDDFISKKGKPFTASLIIDESNNVAFNFD